MADKDLATVLEPWIRKQDVRVKKATVLINGKTYRKTGLHKIVADMTPREIAKYDLFDLTELPDRKVSQLFRDVFDLMKSVDAPESELAVHDGKSLLERYGVAELLNHEEYKNQYGYVVYKRDTLEITDINYMSIKRRFDPEQWGSISQKIPLLRVEYDPYSDWREKVKQVTEGDLAFTHLNLYRPPPWSQINVRRPQLPPMIKEFLEFLFPDQKDLHFVLGWLYNAMAYRSKTYLFLVGGQGAGKTTFAYLVKRLIGEHNTVKAKEDFLRNTFNDIIENKRFVYLDEFHATTVKETDILKSRIEDDLTLEGKHKDQKVVTNYASFMLINNYFTSVRIDPSTGRKFSVPEITDESILKAKGQDFIDKLRKSIASDNHIAHFANYIKQNFRDSIEPHAYLHGLRYEKVTREAACEGTKTLINLLIDEGYDEPIPIREIRYSHKKMGKSDRFPSTMEITKFFEDFTWNRTRVGEVFMDEDQGAMLKRHEDYKAPQL